MSESVQRPQGYWRVPDFVKDLDSEVVSKLETFYFEILRYNQRFNLIPKRTEIEGDIAHILDSIIGGRIVLSQSKAAVIYDIGSGNGLPGLVMAILDPKRKIVLVETEMRKIEFMNLMIGTLGLSNAATLHKRLEDLEQDSVGCAVSRGFASISKVLLLGRKAIRPGGEFYHFKGSSWVREVAQIPSQICTFFSPRLVQEYELPILVTKMGIVCTRKLGD